MIEFGKTLREAREKKGLTPSQIAEQTHLLPQIVEDLEREDFHRISAPIYGRGFVKLYCEAVGLEPKPLVDEFMAILNGEREPAIRVRQVELPPVTPAEPAEPTPPPAPTYTQPELGDETDAPAPAGAVASPRQEAPQVMRQETRDASGNARPEARGPGQEPRQYHPDYANAVPPFAGSINFGRVAILAGGAIVLVALLVWGGRAVYRASMGIAGEPQPASLQEKTAETPKAGAKPKGEATSASLQEKAKETPKAAAKPTAKRTPKDIPPLYID